MPVLAFDDGHCAVQDFAPRLHGARHRHDVGETWRQSCVAGIRILLHIASGSTYRSQPAHRCTGGDQGVEGHEVHCQLDAEIRSQLQERGQEGSQEVDGQEIDVQEGDVQEGVGKENQQVPQKALTKGREPAWY